jgi:tubulin polyglutamylase TTLL6/13
VHLLYILDSIRDFYDHHQKKPGGIYIAKPVASSQGRGIFLFKNPEDPTISEMLDPRNYNQIIIQQYLSDPFLIDGTKFDFRIYVLVTSADPLEAMIYGEGLGRFATCKYEPPKSSNSGNVFMHLTNYSINKFNTEFDRNQDSGSKRYNFMFDCIA